MGNDAMLAGVLAFLISVAAGPRAITRFHRLKYGQTISEDVPERHRAKAGTPTMGGVIILGGAAIAALIFGGLASLRYLWVILAHAALGFLDDYLIVRRGKSLGLRAREKLTGQIMLAIFFVVSLSFQPGSHPASSWAGMISAGNWLMAFLAVVWMVGISNAANLTDGLDGLAGGVSAIGAAACGLVALASAQGTSQVVSWSISGGCLGFLWYNAHPARIFMGDTGSLALGAYFATVMLTSPHPAAMVAINFIFLAETVTWLMQVGYFKLSGGRRIFRMAPIHHHFELVGWPEPQIVARFWIAAAVSGGIGVWMVWRWMAG
ncbi:MAG: phospho-N-acetylmuramoyl-pentapeptide-transferase [Armatimonadetes bacterium]|nr:phospho-N-acetylmuramoyl-pentapeptide-transferase [Armatimonadota bacterium]